MAFEKILNNVKLPTLSKTLNKIIELEKKNPVTLSSDIVKIIDKDPLLSIHIMKVANSPLFGFSNRVNSIAHAINLLGITQIRNMAFSFSMFDFIKKIKYSKEFRKTFKSILKRSLLMGAVAGTIGKDIKGVDSDKLYIAGLMANVGQFILFLYSPEKYTKIYSENIDLLKAEKKAFKTNFIEIGVAYCEKEGFPKFLASAIKNQFELSDKTNLNKIICISTDITEFLLTEGKNKELIISLEKRLKNKMDISIEGIKYIIEELPLVMDTFIDEFPETQSEINKFISTSSEIIIELMKSKMNLVIESKEQAEREILISKEKMFIRHMLFLSKEFSTIISPLELIKRLFAYFDKNLKNYKIKVLYYGNKYGDKEAGTLYSNDKNFNGRKIKAENHGFLINAKDKNEPVFASKNDIKDFGLESELTQIVFPISYHNMTFGFIILGVKSKDMQNIEYILSYMVILANIIANSFQNYCSVLSIKNEVQKKVKIADELIRNDKILMDYEKNEDILSKSNVLEEILPIIFHKLKNKLTPILGYSQLLSTLFTENKVVDKLKKIERNANELTNILDTMSGEVKANANALLKKTENLNKIILKLKPFFKKIEDSNNIEVELNLDNSIKDFPLNIGQIVNMLKNIIDNSLEALNHKTGNQKSIKITTSNHEDKVILTIKDNGTGIEEHNIYKIWAPFFSTNKRVGIGLTACEKVLTNHKAKYEIKSEFGKYTEFIAEFPVNIEEEYLISDKQEKDNTEDGLNILIVDDEEFLATLMKEILEIDSNREIYTATNGEEAIELIKKHDFKLIVSDIKMPKISGMDIHKYLKEKGLADRLLMVTGNPYEGDTALFLRKNKINYLIKPFGLMEFRRFVNQKINN